MQAHLRQLGEDLTIARKRRGERMIRIFDRPVRLSLMEYLYFAGDDRFGALGVSLSLQTYHPHVTGPLPQLPDLGSIEDSITEIFSGAPVNDQWMRLVKPGASMGGARPKALIELAEAGVSGSDLTQLAAQIDRPFLREQRRAW